MPFASHMIARTFLNAVPLMASSKDKFGPPPKPPASQSSSNDETHGGSQSSTELALIEKGQAATPLASLKTPGLPALRDIDQSLQKAKGSDYPFTKRNRLLIRETIVGLGFSILGVSQIFAPPFGLISIISGGILLTVGSLANANVMIHLSVRKLKPAFERRLEEIEDMIAHVRTEIDHSLGRSLSLVDSRDTDKWKELIAITEHIESHLLWLNKATKRYIKYFPSSKEELVERFDQILKNYKVLRLSIRNFALRRSRLAGDVEAKKSTYRHELPLPPPEDDPSEK